ncbi:GNAT family N-acetyltransferase [Pseudonocardia sp. HH130630-07]|uniref:GNAT family N-acetyltransferase n=1 Tax=Pseudonocardia sp. HH130630-07 TaxID=1690815 RepID=UPI000814FAA2|nr:GNAT family N-acetyltransferase [Pseudonocardia sp. HH130630-07]ANY10423.1 GNAT family acetyltransferase [Pseudonocardia sp. HH130630-07]
MLADDPLGAGREDPADPAPYRAAFERIDADPSELLLVADSAGTVVGTLQLSLLPGLARRGALRAQIEAVRVAADRRGAGLGETMVRYAADEARRRGAVLVQLTSDRSRTGAHRFYERLGFVASHEGYKLPLV